MTDKNDIEISDGDIIDIHQTVNGYNLFIVYIINGEYAVTYMDGRPYEYDTMELLEANVFGEKELEIVANKIRNIGDIR